MLRAYDAGFRLQFGAFGVFSHPHMKVSKVSLEVSLRTQGTRTSRRVRACCREYSAREVS